MSEGTEPRENGSVEEVADAMLRAGMIPEHMIEDEDEFMFTAQGGDDGSGPEHELERDFLEPEDRLVKSRLSDAQTLGIPKIELMFRLFPEFGEQDLKLLQWFLARHEQATVARDGLGREEAVEVLKATKGVGGDSGEENAPGAVMQQFIGDEEDEDE